MSSSLSFESISQRFGTEQVLDDITLTVPESSCVALLGASGSGKSTLLRIAAGLLDPTAGTVLIDGEDVTALDAEHRESGLMFQRPLLFPHLSVVDNVAFAARMAGRPKAEARRQAREYLELVQLGEFARRMPGELSGGQEQRVALARALARQPRILLLDEPFSSLDLRLREDMYDLIDSIREQLRPTIVLVTHDRREAAVLADTIAVLDHGRILQHAPVAQIHHQPASPAVNRILGGLNEVPGVVRAGAHHSPLGRIPVPQDTPEGRGLLMPRQESLQLTTEAAATRHETHGTRATASWNDPNDADAHPGARGTVTQVRPSGAHSLVRVELEPGPGEAPVTVAIEVTGTPALRPGDAAGVALGGVVGWVVPL
ncbi:ABC transporter ATP-binding protein [Nesterenkonia sandarakina]|uniref:ABC-type quaternary amine transporter n=1 Tax=Nesterenkonia sandarakina TaxID=272918 RepID=A0A7Z0E8T2_9MICC|nr:ABC transporter ATP-binding protein [Nesterenkonia sandarakina]NYJ17172.1 putative spermidine/putrescine transport system ATP-binding protein [Nesterenkonia sandarakina]